MRKILSAALVLPFIVSSAVGSMAAAAVGDNKPPSITVVGSGKVKAKPDEAALHMGVVTSGTTASEALAANNQAMAALMATLNEHGIQTRDVQTANFSVYPEYRRPEPRPTDSVEPDMPGPSISGYRVSNEVRVRIRDISHLGKLLDAVVRSGANNINGIGFAFSNPESLLSEARTKAIADAKARAEQYAAAAGTKVGKVLYIDEQASANVPYPMAPNMGYANMAKDSGGVAIASGEQEIGASVTVVYAIE